MPAHKHYALFAPLVMACTGPFDAFRLATESLSRDLHHRASWQGIWVNLINKTEYPRGTGVTQSTFTIGRSEATDDEECWVRTTDSDHFCDTTWNDVNYGHCETTFQPEQFGLRGPIICQDDLIFNFNADAFLESYMRALEKRSRRSIENRYANLYTHFVPKNVADTSFTYEGPPSSAPPLCSPDLTLPEAECELTQEMLDTVAAELNEEGASEGDTDGWITMGPDGPLYPLYIGQVASQRILLNNSEMATVSGLVDSQLTTDRAQYFKRIGATRTIKNFRHIINLFPPRYVYDSDPGVYHRINTWTMNACSKGYVAEINPDWRAAPFEGAWVLSPLVFRSQLVRAVNSSAGLTWDPKSYFGDWEFVTGGQEIEDPNTVACYDPLKKYGRHFGIYWHAPEPIIPVFGRFIIFRRCPVTEYACPTCAS